MVGGFFDPFYWLKLFDFEISQSVLLRLWIIMRISKKQKKKTLVTCDNLISRGFLVELWFFLINFFFLPKRSFLTLSKQILRTCILTSLMSLKCVRFSLNLYVQIRYNGDHRFFFQIKKITIKLVGDLLATSLLSMSFLGFAI